MEMRNGGEEVEIVGRWLEWRTGSGEWKAVDK